MNVQFLPVKVGMPTGSVHCIALHCIHCIALHCIALHGIALHFIAAKSIFGRKEKLAHRDLQQQYLHDALIISKI